jgi:hypothetical protein
MLTKIHLGSGYRYFRENLSKKFTTTKKLNIIPALKVGCIFTVTANPSA